MTTEINASVLDAHLLMLKFFSYAKRKNNQAEILLFCFLYAKKNDAKNKRERGKALTFPHVAQKRFDTGVTWVELKHCQTQRPNEQRTIITDNANWITQNSRNVLGISPWNSQLTQAFPKKGNPGSFILHCYPDTQTG
jgi:hypothetical protein